MSRPACVVHVDSLEPQKRPRFRPDEGAGAWVRELRSSVGLRHMGVSLREVPSGLTSTHRHWHDVDEEWAYVLSGVGIVRIGAHRLDVRAGHFVGFPPGPRPHHFVATTDEPLVLLEGGERNESDAVRYPDLGLVRSGGAFVPDTDPPKESGDPSQCVHIDDLPLREFQHARERRAHRTYRSLHTPTGLSRQAVRWTRVAAGAHSTAYHTHDRTDEWVYVLGGKARVRVGDERFEVREGDFVGHPAGGAPHAMEPESDLVYLMGGMVDPSDVVTYPESGTA